MDVISLFLKMRVRFDKISIDVTAETSDTIPMVYTAFHATYHIDGNIGDAAKIGESDSPFTGKILWRRTYDEKDRPDYLRYLTERRTA